MRPRKKDRQLPACVYHRHGAYYLVKRGKWTRLGTGLAASLAEYARLTESSKRGGMSALIDSALVTINATVGESTRTAYKYAARKLHYGFDHFEPKDVKAGDVTEFKLGLIGTPGMANRCVHLLRQVFDYARAHRIVEHNPAYGVPSLEMTPRTRLLTEREFVGIYEHAPEHLQSALDLWRLTGQRVVDVLQIRIRDLRETGIYFRQAKTGKELIVRWNPELSAVVERARKRHSNVLSLDRDRPLLRGPRGRELRYHAVYKQFCKAVEEAGLSDVQIRDLRAVAVTRTNQQVGKKAAQDIAGHTTESMTTRYIRDHEIPVVDGPTFGQVLDVGQKR